MICNLCSAREYKDNKSLLKLHESHNSDTFAILEDDDNKYQYLVSWNSSFITQPNILNLEKYNLSLIGFYDKVYGIDNLGKVVLTLGLYNPFDSFLEYRFGFLIFSETTITYVLADNLVVSNVFNLPDIIINYEANSKTNEIEVECLGGEKFVYKV